MTLLEQTPENQQHLLIGLEYLLNISYTDEPEVFKVCLDYWHVLVCDLYQSDGDAPGGAPSFLRPAGGAGARRGACCTRARCRSSGC